MSVPLTAVPGVRLLIVCANDETLNIAQAITERNNFFMSLYQDWGCTLRINGLSGVGKKIAASTTIRK